MVTDTSLMQAAQDAVFEMLGTLTSLQVRAELFILLDRLKLLLYLLDING